MERRRFIVTGASTGVGLATAHKLCALPETREVILACRDVDKAQRSTISWSDEERRRTTIKRLDLCDRKSINAFAQEVLTKGELHVLINNAGTLETSQMQVQGIEKTLLTNHIGPAYLTSLLLPLLLKTAKGEDSDVRIVNVSSRLEKNGSLNYDDSFLELRNNGVCGTNFDGWKAYANSKQLNLTYTNALSQRHPSLKINSVTPGMVNTDLSRSFNSFFLYLSWPLRALMLRTPEQGAEAVVHAATAKGITSGRFLCDSGAVVVQQRKPTAETEVASLARTEELIEYWRGRIV
jgi:NAD(P)-dependent dehydrogenase (short-subunit alcohol dehydrogenase family)